MNNDQTNTADGDVPGVPPPQPLDPALIELFEGSGVIAVGQMFQTLAATTSLIMTNAATNQQLDHMTNTAASVRGTVELLNSINGRSPTPPVTPLTPLQPTGGDSGDTGNGQQIDIYE